MSKFDFARKSLSLSSGEKVEYYSLSALEEAGVGSLSRIPKSVKILLESLVRMQGHPAYTLSR